MNIVILGASRGCGFALLKRLLDEQAGKDAGKEEPKRTCHLLLRDPSAFSQHLSALDIRLPANVLLYQADALSLPSLRSALRRIEAHGTVDVVISSLGALPSLHWKSGLKPRMQKGLERICADGTKNLLDAMMGLQGQKVAPALIVISSNGIGNESLQKLPWILKIFYHHVLTYPHADKHEMEELLHKTYGLTSGDFGGPRAHAMDAEQGGSSVAFDPAKLLIVRPSLLTSGSGKGEYRTSEAGGTLDKAWSIAREDVAHFVFDSIDDSSQQAADGVAALRRSGAFVVSY